MSDKVSREEKRAIQRWLRDLKADLGLCSGYPDILIALIEQSEKPNFLARFTAHDWHPLRIFPGRVFRSKPDTEPYGCPHCGGHVFGLHCASCGKMPSSPPAGQGEIGYHNLMPIMVRWERDRNYTFKELVSDLRELFQPHKARPSMTEKMITDAVIKGFEGKDLWMLRRTALIKSITDMLTKAGVMKEPADE